MKIGVASEKGGVAACGGIDDPVVRYDQQIDDTMRERFAAIEGEAARYGITVNMMHEIDDSPAEAIVRMPGSNSLAVRGWRPGDRFRPIGLDGRKKRQDYFVDRKVPRADRRHIPLVVDEWDRIVWVAGHGVSEDFRVTDPAQPVLILRLKPLGGLA